jgi:TPR repeat protein
VSWLEKLVARLGNHVNKQLDELTDKQAFDAAQDAYLAGDYPSALAGYQSLAEKGHGRAAALAGEMHLSGVGTKVSGLLALKYFEMGTNANDPDAIALLGMMYAAGKAGVKIDYLKARPLLEKAAQAGDRQAMTMLAMVKRKQAGKR